MNSQSGLSRRSPWIPAVALPLACLAPLFGPALAQEVIDARPARDQSTLRFEEILSIGSLTGPTDNFGRVIDAVLDGRDRILVLDDFSHHFKVFGIDGSHVATVGRKGEGPGEFLSLEGIAVGPADSVYVWDSARADISVFSPDYEFVRNVRVSPAWLVNSVVVGAGGRLLVAAVGRGDRFPLKVVDSGGVLQEAGPLLNAPDLLGYESSLLGGFLARSASGYVYTKKSPYEITFFDAALDPVRVCRGPEYLTTDPESVVSQEDGFFRLRWGNYAHSVSILPLPDGLWLNTILDRKSDRLVLHAIDDLCQIVAVTEVPVSSGFPSDARGNLLLINRYEPYSRLTLSRVYVESPP